MASVANIEKVARYAFHEVLIARRNRQPNIKLSIQELLDKAHFEPREQKLIAATFQAKSCTHAADLVSTWRIIK